MIYECLLLPASDSRDDFRDSDSMYVLEEFVSIRLNMNTSLGSKLYTLYPYMQMYEIYQRTMPFYDVRFCMFDQLMQ